VEERVGGQHGHARPEEGVARAEGHEYPDPLQQDRGLEYQEGDGT
jgi:hypothetical protein